MFNKTNGSMTNIITITYTGPALQNCKSVDINHLLVININTQSAITSDEIHLPV